MSYSADLEVPLVRERSYGYPQFPFKEMIYEVSLKTAVYNDWLKEIHGAHRLLQALLQGQLAGHYQLLDLIIQPEGLFTRVTLKNGSSLSDFLKWVKERSCPAGGSPNAFWDDELQWIKLIPPERLTESTRSFLQKAGDLHREVHRSQDGSPHLFFYFRDQQFIP